MAKKLNKQNLKFDVSKHAFTNMGAIVPNTCIIAGEQDMMNSSCKNSFGKVTTSYKIGLAMTQMRDNSEYLILGTHNKEPFYMGSFTKEDEEEVSYIIDPSEQKIYASSFNDESLYTIVVAKNLAEMMLDKRSDEKGMEIFNCLNALDLNVSFLDSDQQDMFIKLCDSVYYEAKNLNGYDMVKTSAERILEMVTDTGNYVPKFNLIGFISQAEPLTLEVDGEDVEIPMMSLPTKGKKMAKKKGKVAAKEVTLGLMSDAEAKKLPAHVQEMRQKAIAFYEENKEFLTEEQMSVIKSFNRGRIWKLGTYGPSATGKTSFIKCLAGALKLPYAIVVGSKGMDETKLFGKYVLKDGNTVFEDGPLTEMMRYGGLFLLDEENMVAPEVVSSMNSVLDDTRMVTLDSGETVHCHDSFRYAEAMNMAYAGTVEQNLSHQSRIQLWLKFKGYDQETEAKIVAKETSIDVDLAKKMVEVKNVVSDILKTEGDDTTQRVDLRSCIAWADRTIDCDGDVVKASLSTVLSLLVKEDDEVESSATVEEFENSQEVARDVLSIIQEKFRAQKQNRDWTFEDYSL